MAGQRFPVLNLGSQIPTPSDFAAEIDSYRAQAEALPAAVGAPILKTLDTCAIFMSPENFVPMRIRGCLNSVLAQLRAASPQA
jgi:hypothetical protein